MAGEHARHYLRTPLGLVLLVSAAFATCLLWHFGHLILEHRVHELMLIPYLLLVALPIVAIFVYRHQQRNLEKLDPRSGTGRIGG